MSDDYSIAHPFGITDTIGTFEPMTAGQWVGTRFQVDPREQSLHELAQRYHEECEAYDRTVCSGMQRGVAMPRDSYEFGLINRNALRVRDRLYPEAARLGFSRDAWMKAIQGAASR